MRNREYYTPLFWVTFAGVKYGPFTTEARAHLALQMLKEAGKVIPKVE